MYARRSAPASGHQNKVADLLQNFSLVQAGRFATAPPCIEVTLSEVRKGLCNIICSHHCHLMGFLVACPSTPLDTQIESDWFPATG